MKRIILCSLISLITAMTLGGCSCGANPIVGDWQSDRTGSVYRFQEANDGTIEAISVSRDENRLIAWYTRDQTAEQRRLWSSGPARGCLLRRGELGIVMYRGLHAIGDGLEGESRNRGVNYSGRAGCRVDEEWVRYRFVIRDNNILEVRTLGDGQVLSSFHRFVEPTPASAPPDLAVSEEPARPPERW